MANPEIAKLPCIACTSSDAMAVYERGDGYCYSCTTFFKPKILQAKGISVENGRLIEGAAVIKPKIPKKSLNGTNSRKMQFDELKEIMNYPIRGFNERGILKEVCEHYGVRVSYDENGEVDAHYYPYEKESYKVRALPKEFRWAGSSSKRLFGQDLFNAGGRKIIIAEGEIDALSVATASYKRYKKFYPIVAIPSASMIKTIIEQRSWLRSFKEVILCFDQDDAGQEAVRKATQAIGYDKVLITKLHKKDANEVLTEQNANGSENLMTAIFDAARFIPNGIIATEDIWQALEEYSAKESVPYPACMHGVNKKLKGMRGGEITLFISGTGCLQKSTEVLMHDGSIKLIEDIKVGELVMGDDDTPRTVLELCRGREQMARVTLRDNTSFVCNKSHVLSLVNNDNEGRWGLQQDEIVDVTVEEYLKWSSKRKHLSKAFKSEGVTLEFKALPIDPYVLGVWLGDGTADSAYFTCHDKDIAIIIEMQNRGLHLEKSEVKWRWNSPYGLRESLKRLNVFANKHIPEEYLTSHKSQRLELLAGLLDTDGSYDRTRHVFEFSQKKEHIVLSVKRLAESLGFTTSLGKQKNNKFGNCFRLYISGEGLEKIPCVLPRKQARTRLQKKNPRRYSFTIELLEEEDFYGFKLDGNNRFVLGNFVVTHNSGKSTMFREIMLKVLEDTDDKIGVISLEESPAETARKLSGMALNRNPADEEIPLDELRVGFDKVFGNEKVILLDHQGSMNDTSIIDKLEYMALSGCKYLFVDHVTILVSEGVENLQGLEAQDKIMNDLLRLVKKYPDLWIGLISHLRKAPSGKQSFEDGKLPTMDDIRGCLAYGTKVLTSDGKSVCVEDVKVGDTLMGVDGSERRVLKLCRGKQQMYKIQMKTSNDFFICNEDHMLTLSHNNKMFDISVKDFIKRSESFKSRCKQHYSEGYELPKQELPIAPYALGAWIGDGSKSQFRVMDAGNLGIAERVGMTLGARVKTPGNINREYFSFETRIRGELLAKLRDLNLVNNKHIPEVYLLSSKKDRLELLAGLLDTDGSYSKKDNAFRFYQKDTDIAKSVVRLARSLGLYSTMNARIISSPYSSDGSSIWEVSVTGNISSITAQKLVGVKYRDRYTNPLKRGIKVTKLDVQDYYGFTLDSDGRFLLENHIITHNSGSIKQISFDIIAFARNMNAEKDVERNQIKMAVLKARFTGLTGPVEGARFNHKTGRLEALDFVPEDEDDGDFQIL